MGFPGGSAGKESICNAGDWVQSLGWEDPLENGMATHSSILAWRNPWTVSMESQRVRHDRTTLISLQVKGSAMTVWLLAISPIDTLDLFLILLSKQLNQLWIPVSHTPSSMPPPSRIQN